MLWRTSNLLQKLLGIHLYSFIYSISLHSAIHSFFHPFIHSFIHSSFYPLIYSFILLSTHLFIHSLRIHLVNFSSIHSSIHPSINSCNLLMYITTYSWPAGDWCFILREINGLIGVFFSPIHQISKALCIDLF